MKRKLLLFDVDGTLISYDGVLPASTVEGIRRAKANGHLVFTVTGRPRNRATEGGIEVNGCICGNGAYIDYDGLVLKDMSLPDEAVALMTDYLDARDMDYFLEGNEGLYGSRNFEFRAVPTYEKYGLKNPVIRKLYPMMEFPESMHQSKITKVNYILRTPQDYLDFKAAFGDYQCLTWGGKGEAALFGDCATAGIDKEKAIYELIEYLQIPREDIYAFGDAEVDIPMFRAAGTSICVGSGREGAKAAADYVTNDVKEDGIYRALEHFGLI